MKRESILILVLILSTIAMFLAAYHIDKQDEKIKQLESKLNKTFTIDEVMFIYKEGHRKGALSVTGNYLNFLKMYNPNIFKNDSLYFRSVIEKLIK